MAICIHSGVLGTRKHMLCDTGSSSFSWVAEIPKNAWIVGDKTAVKSMEHVLELLDVKCPELFPESHIKAMRSLCDNNTTIPWHLALPKEIFSNKTNAFLKKLIDLASQLENESYVGIFLEERALLQNLVPAHINTYKLDQYIKKEPNPTNMKCLQTFRVRKDNMAPPIKYNQVATTTGRLTVMSGPQILTLPKKYRDIIFSKTPQGEVWQLDFVSLEPRVLKAINQSEVSKDLYLDIAENLFGSRLSRDQVKLAVLCALYGISASRLAKMIGDSGHAESVIKKIRDYFEVASLVSRLRKQLRAEGTISNFFGRRLQVEKAAENVLISHYVQSTACDVALLGFNQLLHEAKTICKVDPLFIIHDALIVDVPKESQEIFKNLVTKGAFLQELGNFPLSTDIISKDAE